MKRIALASAGLLMFTGCQSMVAPDLRQLDAVPFERLGNQGTLAFERILASGASTLFTIDLRSQQVRDLGVFGGNTGYALSPDGRKIASIWTNSHSESDVYVTNVDGSARTRMGSVDRLLQSPTWSPDGNTLLVSSGSGSAAIYSLDMRITTPDQVPVKRWSFNFCSSIRERMSISANGDVLFAGAHGCSLLSAAQGINFLRADSLVFTAVPEKMVGDSTTREHAPAWSPDGDRFAYIEQVFVDSRNGSNGRTLTRVWNASWNGGGRVLVASLNAPALESRDMWTGDNAFSLAWSPDGQSIAFNHYDGAHTSHVYVVNADGSGLTQVTFTNDAVDRSISWSR